MVLFLIQSNANVGCACFTVEKQWFFLHKVHLLWVFSCFCGTGCAWILLPCVQFICFPIPYDCRHIFWLLSFFMKNKTHRHILLHVHIVVVVWCVVVVSFRCFSISVLHGMKRCVQFTPVRVCTCVFFFVFMIMNTIPYQIIRSSVKQTNANWNVFLPCCCVCLQEKLPPSNTRTVWTIQMIQLRRIVWQRFQRMFKHLREKTKTKKLELKTKKLKPRYNGKRVVINWNFHVAWLKRRQTIFNQKGRQKETSHSPAQ